MKYVMIISLLIFAICGTAQTNFSKYTDEAAYYVQQNDHINAIKKFSKALEFKSEISNSYKIADVYIGRGFCRSSLQNYENAQTDFNEALKIKPEYIRVYQLKSAVYLQSKQPDLAIEWADKGLEIRPGDEELKGTKSQALTDQKKYDESIKVLHSILQENPKDKNSLKYIGHNYQMKKNYDSAQKYFTEAIKLNPLDYASLFDRGITKSYLKDMEGARQDIEMAMKIDSAEKWIGYNNIAYFLKLKQQDYKGALEMFDKTIELNPKFAYAYSNRSFAKLNLGDIKGAYQDIKKSLELDSKNAYAYKNLAMIYLKEGKKSDACYNLNKAKSLGYQELYDDDVNNLILENCSK